MNDLCKFDRGSTIWHILDSKCTHKPTDLCLFSIKIHKVVSKAIQKYFTSFFNVNNLEKLNNKIIIIVSHRKNTLKFCDKIAFMNDGKIEDIDDFESLFNSNENFKKIFYKDL